MTLKAKRACPLIALLALCAGATGCNWLWKLDADNDPARCTPACEGDKRCISGQCVRPGGPVDGGIADGPATEQSTRRDADGGVSQDDYLRRDVGCPPGSLIFLENFNAGSDAWSNWSHDGGWCAQANPGSWTVESSDGGQGRYLQFTSPTSTSERCIQHNLGNDSFLFNTLVRFQMSIKLSAPEAVGMLVLHLQGTADEMAISDVFLRLKLSSQNEKVGLAVSESVTIENCPVDAGISSGFRGCAQPLTDLLSLVSEWWQEWHTLTLSSTDGETYYLTLDGEEVLQLSFQLPFKSPPTVNGVILYSFLKPSTGTGTMAVSFDDIQVCIQ